MRLIISLHKVFFLVLIIAAQAAAAAAASRPNVLLIVSEDNGPELGCYGDRYARTPHLDRLAAGGVRFTNAYSACAVCSPTRAAILTGKYPARLLLTDWLPAGRWNPQARLRARLDRMISERLPAGASVPQSSSDTQRKKKKK